MINKVILVGNLGKDPEVRTFENDNKVASFSIATSESYTDKKTNEKVTNTEWHNIALWGGLASVAEKYLKKGSQVYIEGSLRTRKWQDKEGKDNYTTEVLARVLKMLGSKESTWTPKGEATPTAAPEAPAQADDDLPF